MNSDLQCFEAPAPGQDLDLLGLDGNAFYPTFPEETPQATSTRPCSFTISRKSEAQLSNSFFPGVQVLSSPTKSLTLPSFRSETGARTAPVLTHQLIQQIEGTIARWQEELDRVIQQIQTLYEEGPIVNGWLELQGTEVSANPSKLRHLDTQHLMDYIEEICRCHSVVPQTVPVKQAYQLCGLDGEGRLWSYPCPPEQLQAVCIAISRYHRLRQLGNRRQRLETQLTHLCETLSVLQKNSIKE